MHNSSTKSPEPLDKMDMLTRQKIKAAHRSGARWETMRAIKRRIQGGLEYWRAAQIQTNVVYFIKNKENPWGVQSAAIERLMAKPFMCREEVQRAVKDLWEVLEDGEAEVLDRPPYLDDGSHEVKSGERG